jgi:HlyD family secretion protein
MDSSPARCLEPAARFAFPFLCLIRFRRPRAFLQRLAGVSMRKSLFRPVALKNLSSPEQLDDMLQTARPRAWIGLLAICLVLATALAWSVLGTLPTTVTGRGILLRDGGVYDIHAFGDGVLRELPRFPVGERVHKGQVLGHVSQPVLEQGIAEQQAVLEGVVRAGNASKELSARLARLREQEQAQERAQLMRRIAALEKGHGRAGGVDATAIAHGPRPASDALSRARQRLGQLDVDMAKNDMERQQTLEQGQVRVRLEKAKLAELQLRHRLASVIVCTLDGIVVEMMAMEGEAVKQGQSILSVESVRGDLEAMLYLPPQSNAKMIRPGMRAQVSPTTTRKERYGYLIGSVATVAKFPSTEQGMKATFDNPVLIREMNAQGPPIAVQVTLLPDPASRSGYRWSSRSGAAVELSSGTLVNGTVIIENRRPISLVVPLLRELTGL